MKILFVASEAVPFVKTGGLADVIGSLPTALQKLGHDISVVIPKYATIPYEYQQQMQYVGRTQVQILDHNHEFNLLTLKHNNITFYFIENAALFERSSLYGYWDDAERFIFFCRAALLVPGMTGFIPDIIHSHDWHAALTGIYLKAHYHSQGHLLHTKSIFTIHNLKYQGIFDKNVFFHMMDLNHSYFNAYCLEYYDNVNFMKGGIVFADLVTTVSSTYAWEIQTPQFGENLHDLLHSKKDRLIGIVNGLDYDTYNPSYDQYTAHKFNVDNVKAQKKLNKIVLRKQVGLSEHLDNNMDTVPLLAIVSRLTESKGFELLINIMDELLYNERLQIVVLGTGDEYLVNRLFELSHRHQQKISVNIKFEEALAQQIYAASDIFLMPSRYEPCGLSQMIAMRYGSLPIVHETGGLKDTVIPYNQYTGEGNGFSFSNYNQNELLATIKTTLDIYKHNPNVWNHLVAQAMSMDYSWNNAAKEYSKAYEWIKYS